MSNKWYLVNVVWYDGCDAFVGKFVLQVEGQGEDLKVTHVSEVLTKKYLDGNGEILKFDPLYPVDLDDILAIKEHHDDKELQAAYDRFKNMWF